MLKCTTEHNHYGCRDDVINAILVGKAPQDATSKKRESMKYCVKECVSLKRNILRNCAHLLKN